MSDGAGVKSDGKLQTAGPPASIHDDQRAISDIRASATKNAGTVTKARKSAEKSAERIEELKQDAEGAATEIRECKDTAVMQTQEMEESVKRAAELCEQIDARNNEVSAFASKAKAQLDSIASVVAELATTSATVTQHQDQLEELRGQYLGLVKSIEGLLPGATSAGLAVSFRERKQSHTVAAWLWAGTAVASIAAILGVALWGKGSIFATDALITLEAAGTYVLSRLPLVGPPRMAGHLCWTPPSARAQIAGGLCL